MLFLNKNNLLTPSPNCSEKLFEVTDYFLLEKKSDQRKLFFGLTKKVWNEKT